MKVGIDLGTTNSAIAYVDHHGYAQIISNKEGERTTPSVLLYEDDTFIVGSVAKESSIHAPLDTVQFVKRQIGNNSYKFYTDNGTSYTPEELSAIVLKKLKEDAEAFLGEEVTDAVITVPAYFDDAQRKATQDAGKIAGLRVLKIINEPTAAALAYSADKSGEAQNILVYDLGGGTFDVTVLTLSDEQVLIRATDGNRNLGGFDFDNEIIQSIVKQIEQEHGINIEDDEEAFQELREKAEDAKKILSIREKTNIILHVNGVKVKISVTRAEFLAATQRLIDLTKLIMEDVMDEAELEWEELDKILLVGGSTRIPAIHHAIKELTGLEPSFEVNPDEVVAMGAAIQASQIDVDATVMKKEIIDVNSHSLGVLADDEFNESKNSIILPKNTPIPAEAERVFYTAVDDQESVELTITEGEDTDPEYVNEIGKCEVSLKPRPAGSPIKISISYDENGIVHVKAMDEVDHTLIEGIEIERKSNLSSIEVDELKEKINNITIE